MNRSVSGKVSVIMGVYNCEKTLPTAIESILSQTYKNFELIICDDCSTDNTYAVAQNYKDNHPDRIVLLQNEVNSFLPYTLNHCLEYATGEYIARMDGDDISKPERFEKQVKYLIENTNVDCVGTAMQMFNDKDGKMGLVVKPKHPDKYVLRDNVPFNHATVMLYKKVFDDLKGYTVSKRTIRGQDYDLWFRFYYKGYMGDNIQEPLYLVREDEKAIKRRSLSVRWKTFQTQKMGFKLLGFPKIWLVRPFFTTLFKSMIPAKALMLYRKCKKTD